MRILVLEPFGGGSHAAFYRDWQRYSAHEFTILELPAVHWKWRSRHGSLTLASQANELVARGARFDAVFCSDMLNLPEWRGFANRKLNSLPAVMYFHENQFTYPLAAGQTRDYHYAYSNVLSMIAAEQTWFNSSFHWGEFGHAARAWLRRMPDYPHLENFQAAWEKARICPPGFDPPLELASRPNKPHWPPTLGWVSRWEHDKRPDLFVDAMQQLLQRQLDFRLILLGQQFATRPSSMLRLLEMADTRILHCGYADSRAEYWRWLSQMDIVVSTADHEFFGIGIVEAVYAGARPLLPNRLSYPEVFGLQQHPDRQCYFYDDFPTLVEQLATCLRSKAISCDLSAEVRNYCWSTRASQYDTLISEFA